MSSKPSITRIKNIRSTDFSSSRQSFTNRSIFEESKVSLDESSQVLNKKTKPLKLQASPKLKQPPATSRRRIYAVFTSGSPRKFNLSMYTSPSNKSSRSTRSRFFSVSTSNTLTFPMSPTAAVEHFKDFLSEYELTEIFEFKEIWFCPSNVKRSKLDVVLNNNGFDNDKGDYKITVGDHIQYRYQVLGVIGNGSFGQVCKCLDHKTKETIALKIIKNKKKFHKQGMVEAKLLTVLQENDPKDSKHIVRSKSHFIFRNHICITFELLSINLYELIKVNNFQRLSSSLVCRFAVQILTALDFSSQLGIIHCDLKPENILLMNLQKSGIKIIDFGSGCFENERIYTYIQSRFYRAPEIMLGIPYTTKIDIWSCGCILAELYTGRPLFPGETEAEQFCRIMEIIGAPPAEMLESALRRKVFFDSNGKPRLVLNSRGKLRIPGSKNLQDVLCSDELEFVGFLRKLLTWKPELRPSASEALKHPWVVRLLSKEIGHIRRSSKTFIDTHCI